MHEVHNVLSFLQERMKIRKVGKRLANLYDKKEFVLDIRNLKHIKSFKSELIFKNVDRSIKFSQKA